MFAGYATGICDSRLCLHVSTGEAFLRVVDSLGAVLTFADGGVKRPPKLLVAKFDSGKG